LTDAVTTGVELPSPWQAPVIGIVLSAHRV